MTSMTVGFGVVIGVDTHKRTHTATVVSSERGATEAVLTVPADPGGFQELFAAASRFERRCWAIEGCGSWGHGLVGWLMERGEHVVEVDRPNRPARRMGIKNDEVDSLRAARETLVNERPANPREHGRRDAIAAAHAARRSALGAATDAERQLLSFVVTAPEQLAGRVRGLNTRATVNKCARWRPDTISDPSTRSIATIMHRVAQRVIVLRAEVDDLERVIKNLVAEWRPDLLERRGVGPITSAVILGAWSHQGRIHSEAAFAMLAGCAPIPASSGQTIRHRLNRQGDRQLNSAIHTIYLQRARTDERTKAYIARRLTEGKTPAEIRRCLKRYIARELFNLLEKPLDNQ